jgi:hypothetical protein
MWWLIPTAIGVGQTIYGGIQANRSKKEYERLQKERERTRPTMPEDINRLVSRTERTAMEGLPMRSRYEDMISGRSATGVAAMREGAMTSTEYLSGVTDVYGKELEELNRLATQEAVFRLEAEKDVSQALQTRAGYDFQIQGMRYGETQQDMQMAAQGYQAGQQNMWAGIQTIAGAGMQAGMNKQRLAELDKIYGSGGGSIGSYQRPSTATVRKNALESLSRLNVNPEGVINYPNKVQSVFALDNSMSRWAYNMEQLYQNPIFINS